MSRHNPMYQGQPQTRTEAIRALFQTNERFQDARSIRLGNPRSIVIDVKRNEVPGRRGMNDDLPFCEAARIAQ